MRGRRNRQIGSAQISEFSAVLVAFFLILLFPLINLISLSTAVATGYLAARQAAGKAGDSIDFRQALASAEGASNDITSSGFGKFAGLKPVGGYNGSGMDLYLTDTNINTNVNITHGPNTPAVSALDPDNYLYAYDAVLTYDVGPFMNLSSVPLVGNVAGLGKPVRMTFEATRNVEHLTGITIGGGGYVTSGGVITGSSNSGILAGNTSGGTGGAGYSGSGGSYGGTMALNSAGTDAGVFFPMSGPRRPWQLATTNGVDRYIPNVLSSFHVQLTGVVDYSIPHDVTEVDLYETPPEDVAKIHAYGGYAIAYMNTGAWQPGMPDSGLYPPSVIGQKPMSGWHQERWLDIRQIAILRPIIQAKLQEAKNKGFDAVDPDNMDGYTNTDEFGLTKADQIAFDKMVAQEAHAVGLAVMLKNSGDMMADLVDDFDGTVAEQAFRYKEAAIYQPMRDENKPVFLIEYNGVSKTNLADAVNRGFNVTKAKMALNGKTKMVTPN